MTAADQLRAWLMKAEEEIVLAEERLRRARGLIASVEEHLAYQEKTPGDYTREGLG